MATLVQSQIIPLPFPRDPLPAPFVVPPSPLDTSIAELAPLASQHHTSEYNRLKFGLQGCPIRYLPLSKHLPEFFLQLQQRQAQCAQEKSWWPSNKAPTPAASPIILGSRGALLQDTHLQKEIEAAMAEPLHNKPYNPASLSTEMINHTIKTSLTHPINISAIVPHELIPQLASHLLINPLSPLPPTVFEISPSFYLDRLLTPSFPHRQRAPNPTPPLQPRVLAAISGSLSGVVPPQKPEQRHSPILMPRSASIDILPSEKPSKMTHSNASSISLSLSLTITDTDTASSSGAHKQSSEPPPLSLNTPKTAHGTLDDGGAVGLPPLTACNQTPPLLIGNLFLSSCPGKKVRLQGPVKGRSGVCRDLDTDLRRMKDLGVGCIICCLDDSELEFLGAPWVEYEALARANGIDVLRVPTPEGLAPLSPTCLDADLTKVINTYTLHGVPVLVHCRGGVGRAGVIACCWLIRLGLCGWVEADGTASTWNFNEEKGSWSGSQIPHPPVTGSNACATGPRKDTIMFVEKVIAVVRRRRSLKAIETYEQVQFLVDFVEYLRARPHSEEA
ncbi:hypothetical protein D9615_002426 [Tricholomella constricta]|uniref:Tyrosine specific protein phosphatases domain-containing protein n=1 Tax=Tricholomella constricta TaxID=117010 RepID=A0A8H5HMI7_9AGAR|nr:hypothetical protein D9615_002426 [Tricholomella constricta]